MLSNDTSGAGGATEDELKTIRLSCGDLSKCGRDSKNVLHSVLASGGVGNPLLEDKGLCFGTKGPGDIGKGGDGDSGSLTLVSDGELDSESVLKDGFLVLDGHGDGVSADVLGQSGLSNSEALGVAEGRSDSHNILDDLRNVNGVITVPSNLTSVASSRCDSGLSEAEGQGVGVKLVGLSLNSDEGGNGNLARIHNSQEDSLLVIIVGHWNGDTTGGLGSDVDLVRRTGLSSRSALLESELLRGSIIGQVLVGVRIELLGSIVSLTSAIGNDIGMGTVTSGWGPLHGNNVDTVLSKNSARPLHLLV